MEKCHGKPQSYEVIKGTEYIAGELYETSTLHPETAEVSINTEGMYVDGDGLVVRLDGVHNYENSSTNIGGQNFKTSTWKNIVGSGNSENAQSQLSTKGTQSATPTALTAGTANASGHDGKIMNGTGQTAGTWGENYLDFNGTSSWVDLGNINNEKQTLDVTFSSDVTFSEETTSSDKKVSILGNWQENGGGGIGIKNGCIFGSYYINSNCCEVVSNVKVVANKEYSVALTYDGENIILYIDGVEWGRKTVSGTIKTSGESAVMVIGATSKGSTSVSEFFDGKVYTAAVYSKALTAKEVLQNARAGLALAGGITDAEEIEYTIRFSKDVSNFNPASDEVTIGNGTKGETATKVANKVYTVKAKTSQNQYSSQTITLEEGCVDCNGSEMPKTEKKVFIDRRRYAEYNQQGVFVAYYDNLKDALSGAKSENTIKPLMNTVETEEAQLSVNKVITLDLNSKRIAGASDKRIIENLGTMTIKGQGTMSAFKDATNYSPIVNKGTLTIQDATILAENPKAAIYHTGDGKLEVISGKIEGIETNNVTKNNENEPAIQIKGGTLTSTNKSVIFQGASGKATIKIEGGTIESKGNNSTIGNKGAQGKIEISGGTITAAGSSAVYNEGENATINITGGTISSNGKSESGTINNTAKNANITITGGIIKSKDDSTVIKNKGNSATVTIGTINKGTESPSITGKIEGENGCGDIIVNSGKITGTKSSAIETYGNVTVNGGEVVLPSNATGGSIGTISTKSNSSKITINGGTIKYETTQGVAIAVYDNVTGTVEVNGGTISSTATSGIRNKIGNTTIKNGTITAGKTGVYTETGTITLGDNKSPVSENSPNITGKECGVEIKGAGTFNFYDGCITGAIGKSISGTINATPNGYTRRIKKNEGNTTETSYLNNNYKIKFLSDNLMEGKNLKAYNSTNLSVHDNKYTVVCSENVAGCCLPEDILQNGKTYILTYKIKKTSGELKNITGHSPGAVQKSFTIDGKSSSLQYNLEISDANGKQNITDDTNEHTVEFEFTYNETNSNKGVYIQPNRGLTTSVTVELSNVAVYEVIKESNKVYNAQFTSEELATLTKTGYTFKGWYNDNTYTTKLTTSDKFTKEKATFVSVNDITETAYIYGKCSANQYIIKLSLDGGKYNGSTTVTDIIATYDQVVNIPNPTRNGYTFQGWGSTGYRGLGNNAMTGTTESNLSSWGGGLTKDIYFKNLTNKNNETVQLEATWEGGPTFDTGKNVNDKMNTLANGRFNIKSISRSDTIAEEYKTDEHKVSSTDSLLPIYMWFDDNDTIYWWSEGEKVYLNENSSRMFYYCYKLTSIDLKNFDTSKVTDMNYMFNCCYELTSIDLKNFDTSKVTNMSYMFGECRQLTSIDLKNFDTSNVTNMSNMFDKCRQLTSIDLKNFDTSNVTNMGGMFMECRQLTSIDLTNFDTNNVTNMSGMFGRCNQLTSIDLTNFDTRGVTDMRNMFKECSELKNIYVGDKWSTDKVEQSKSKYMFMSCTNIVGGEGTKYDPAKTDKEYAHLDGGTTNPGYFSSKPVAKFFGYNMSNIKQQEGYISKMVKYKENNNTEVGFENDAEKGNSAQPNSSDQENQTTEVKIPQIAKINETTFDTISKAIDLANSGDTIKILENINILEDVTIPENKNIKINLNGKTITSNMTSTINNLGNLTIIGTGIIKNEATNGTVIFNTGELIVENAILTTAQNGGKCIYNNGGNVGLKGGKVVTQGMGAIGIYNTRNGSKSTNGSKLTAKNQSVLQNAIIEATGAGSKCVYNECRLEIKKGNIVVSADDSIGIYNGENAQELSISEDTEILIKAQEIENYDLIKNTDEFKEELKKMKPSYGIYNDSKNNITVEKANMKVERLKSIGIVNKNEGSVTLGKADENYDSASPIIYAISDNTNAIENSEKGKIEFYDGRLVTLGSVKDSLTTDEKKYEIAEEIGKNIVNTMLKLIEFTDIKELTKAE